MISRRNIRIKVMQTLYALTTLEDEGAVQPQVADRILDDKLEQVLDIFTSALLLMTRIAAYAETDAARRSARYLKTAADDLVNTRLSNCAFVQFLHANKTFGDRISKRHLERFVEAAWAKKIYQLLAQTDEYNRYLLQPGEDQDRDRVLFLFIWDKLILNEEGLNAQFMDEWPDWEDDGELITIMVQNFLNNKNKVDFNELLARNKRAYAQSVRTKEQVCLDLVIPKLNNWDKDRVALIDLILLKMGVCEFLFFPTIPTKVTINEFIDIAKQYSTPQSGQFVNGVLDNILKDLLRENRINKIEKNGKDI